jgi:3-methyladenine DNA glycosylase AlkD
MDSQKRIQEIKIQLDQLSDLKRLEMAKTNYPTSMIVKGVTVPNLRPIVKELNKSFKQSPPEEVIAFAKQLNATRILEAQQIAFELIDKNRTAMRRLTLDDLYVFGEGIDNWVSVDHFAGLVAGPAWREGQIPDEVVEEWATSEDRWWRRAAVVCTVALNQKARGGSGDPTRTLKICELVAADKDDMVAKALSWALRELAKRDPDPVTKFVDQNETLLPSRVVREVRRKISTGRK